MAITIANERKYAPYIYITKGLIDGKVSVFVRIALHPGSIATRIGYSPLTGLGYTVQPGTNPNGDPFYDRVEVDIPPSTELYQRWALNDPYGIREQEVEKPLSVTVLVAENASNPNNDNKPSYKISLPFDLITNTETIPADQLIAYNCPYIYLTNPNAEIGDDDPDYAPRCYVPLSKADYAQPQPPLVLPQNASGICTQDIIISNNNASTLTEIPVNMIAANTSQNYQDTKLKTGYFEVTLTYTANGVQTKRKGRVPNRSSDSNPSNFTS